MASDYKGKMLVLIGQMNCRADLDGLAAGMQSQQRESPFPFSRKGSLFVKNVTFLGQRFLYLANIVVWLSAK